MLPKKLRIKVLDFNKNPQKFTKINSSNFNLFIKNARGTGPKFVLSVPKSVDKRSTRRNKVKRIIEQVILSLDKDTNAKKEILIRAKNLISDVIRKSAEAELRQLLQNEFNR